MANRYPSDYDYNYRSADANRRPAGSRPAGARPAGTRPAGSARPAGAARPDSRYASPRPAGARPANSGRPAGSARPDSRYGSAAPRNNPPRRPQKKRRKASGRFYAIIAVAVILLIALILIIAKPFGGKKDPVTTNPDISNNVSTQSDLDAQMMALDDETEEETPHYSTLAEYLSDEDAQVEALSEEEMAKVSDLSINQSLPSEWLNILLLGTDERTLKESARTDTMMICSIHRETGEVKLTSLMRDLNVSLDDIGKYSGEYRLNAAHYFGGANLAMKTINECFGMNIQYYVRVNFFGFRKIAHALGGIDITISEEEMKQINKNIKQQYKLAKQAGIDESDQQYAFLEHAGDVHLDGAQTLAYARIRKIDNDYVRANRQRTVLNELLKKVKTLNYMEFVSLATSMIDQVKTNMEINDILAIAVTVMNNGVGDIESTRLPVNGTYSEERRNDDSRLWDCDWKANELALYNFIYG
ncbi:MAG: LCP family protein [Clostridia bacterium]|nr:LCP family protein [Clostridia bacterium]